MLSAFEPNRIAHGSDWRGLESRGIAWRGPRSRANGLIEALLPFPVQFPKAAFESRQPSVGHPLSPKKFDFVAFVSYQIMKLTIA